MKITVFDSLEGPVAISWLIGHHFMEPGGRFCPRILWKAGGFLGEAASRTGQMGPPGAAAFFKSSGQADFRY